MASAIREVKNIEVVDMRIMYWEIMERKLGRWCGEGHWLGARRLWWRGEVGVDLFAVVG